MKTVRGLSEGAVDKGQRCVEVSTCFTVTLNGVDLVHVTGQVRGVESL